MMQTDSPTESTVGAKNEIKDEAQKSPLQASDIKNMENLFTSCPPIAANLGKGMGLLTCKTKIR